MSGRIKIIVIAGIIIAGCTFLFIREQGILKPSSELDIIAPWLITDEAWKESISNDPTANGYSGYGILQERGSNLAVKEGFRDLQSVDPYLWMNASSYLGSLGYTESIPYLIKSLRHTAWRSDTERVDLLVKLTGQSIGNDFEKWRSWYESQPDPVMIDWESSLGHSPRITSEKRKRGL